MHSQRSVGVNITIPLHWPSCEWTLTLPIFLVCVRYQQWISFQTCSNKCILYVLSFHKCIRIKYKMVNMYGVFLWLVQSSSRWNTIHSSQLQRLTSFSVGCSGRRILSPGQIAVMRKWSIPHSLSVLIWSRQGKLKHGCHWFSIMLCRSSMKHDIMTILIIKTYSRYHYQNNVSIITEYGLDFIFLIFLSNMVWIILGHPV